MSWAGTGSSFFGVIETKTPPFVDEVPGIGTAAIVEICQT